MTEMNFNSIPDTVEIYASIDGGKYEQIPENTLTAELAKGGHTVSVVCIDKRNLQFEIDWAALKKPFLTWISVSPMSFEQTFNVWIMRSESSIAFGYNTADKKEPLGYTSKNPYLRTEAEGTQVTSQGCMHIVKSKAQYISLQLLSIILDLLPLIALTVFVLATQFPIMLLPDEEWEDCYWSMPRLNPLYAVLSFLFLVTPLIIYLFFRYVLKLKKQLKTIVKKSEIL